MLKEIVWRDESSDIQSYFNNIESGFLQITKNEFDELVAIKILENYSEQVFFNHCPKCEKLARTPFAKQCKCGFNWREL